uniref:Uncharacterized protein n=1 Tax=Tanacetum cinerariifolium TaxID=118510 RepID=A0A699J601_TANCI|nr:hypothetical protein [Tanacetum cinerariifolium]
MVESETPKKKKVQEQIDVQLARELEEEMVRDVQRMNEKIARDAEIARVHAKEELHMLIDALDRNNETVAKYLQEYYQFAERRIELINEPASPFRDDSQGKACHTDSGFEADQDRANIAKTFTLPSDSTPRVTSLTADEGRGGIAQSRDDAPIKGRSLDEGEEAAERVSDDTEEMATVLTSMDVASILTSGGVQVVPTATEVATTIVSIPTGSRVVSTASPTIPTAAPIFTTATESTPYTRRKARELEEEMVRDVQRMNEQIARDAEIARVHAKEELHMLIDGLDRNNETVAKYLQEYYQFAKRRIDMISDLLIPVEEVYVEALQVKHPIINWEVHTEGQRSYWKIIRLGGSSASYQFFMDLLKHLDREDLNQLWTLVKETLNIRPAANDKEMEIWVELKRLNIHARGEGHPLRKGLEIGMISYKLQVENYSQIANDLILKIYKIASSPRQQGIPTGSDELPLQEQLLTANEDKFPLLIQSDAIAKELFVAAKVKE